MSRLHRGRRLLKGKLLQHARDTGLIEPEGLVGVQPSPEQHQEHTHQHGPELRATGTSPIDLGSYRRKHRSNGGV